MAYFPNQQLEDKIVREATEINGFMALFLLESGAAALTRRCGTLVQNQHESAQHLAAAVAPAAAGRRHHIVGDPLQPQTTERLRRHRQAGSRSGFLVARFDVAELHIHQPCTVRVVSRPSPDG